MNWIQWTSKIGLADCVTLLFNFYTEMVIKELLNNYNLIKFVRKGSILTRLHMLYRKKRAFSSQKTALTVENRIQGIQNAGNAGKA